MRFTSSDQSLPGFGRFLASACATLESLNPPQYESLSSLALGIQVALMFTFLHAADIHLDSPLRGLDKYDGAPVDDIRNATRRALENLVATAIDEKVSFVVIAGDLYDGDWRDFHTGLYFASQ